MADQHDTAIEQLLSQYRQLAQKLNSSTDIQETQTTLEPIQSLAPEEQISFLKALSKQNDVEAADIMQALYTLSDKKDVRKEARRRLIQFEGKDIYAQWSPLAGRSLSDALEQLSGQAPEGEEFSEEDTLLSQFQSIFEGSNTLFSDPDYLSVVENFLESWVEGDYQLASEHLAEGSPLLEGLSREEWANNRKQWAETAHPHNLRITALDPVEEENSQDTFVIDVGWSVCITDLPEITLAELPLTTIMFPGTGRRWFWTHYTVVQINDTWLIQDMTDEAAQAFQLPSEGLRQHLDEINKQIDEQSSLIEDEDEDEEDEYEEDEDEEKEEDEDEDEEDEYEEDEDEENEDEDEEDEASLADMFSSVNTVFRLSVHCLHYMDALIAQAPQESTELYERAFNLSGTLNEAERAAAYAQQMAEHIPSKRSEALQNLAYAYMLLATQSHENDDHEAEEHYMSHVEPIAREAVAAEKTPQSLILLASIISQDDDKLDEAESLLRQAEKGPLTNDDSIEVESGLAEISMRRGNDELALHHYQNLVHLTPDDGEVWFRVGYLQNQLHHFEDALAALQQSIKLAPSLTESYKGMAEVYLEMNELNKAREIIRQGIEANTDAADLHAALAMVYLQSGDVRSAEKYLRQAEALDDEDEFVQAARERFDEDKKLLGSRSRPHSHKNQHNKPKKKR